MLNATKILSLIETGIFKSLDDVKKAMTDEVAKARAAGTEDVMSVIDRWLENEMHKVPSKQVIKIGPVQASSGGGVEKMIADYSSPAAQAGIQLQHEQLGEELGSMRGYMKSMGTSILEVITVVKAIGDSVGALVKAKDDEEEEEESEVVEVKSAITRAATFIAKAAECSEATTSLTGTAKARMLAKAESYRDKAIAAFKSALTIAAALKSEEGRKLVLKAAKKADVEVNEIEEEESEEAKKSRLTAEATAKAKADAEAEAARKAAGETGGNQADKSNKDGNQDDSAAKALAAVTALSEQMKASNELVQKALAGQAVLAGNVQTVMDSLAGKSRPGGERPAFSLAKADNIAAISTRVQEAMDNGTLDTAGAERARDLVQKLGAAASGVLDVSVVQDMIGKSSQAVQDLFKVAA